MINDDIDIDHRSRKIEVHDKPGACSYGCCDAGETRFHKIDVCGMEMYLTLCDLHSGQLMVRCKFAKYRTLAYQFSAEFGAYIVPCRVVDGQYEYWCDWCAKSHRHEMGTGRRSAHCSGMDSPYKAKGIYIVEGGEAEPPLEPGYDLDGKYPLDPT